jgi:hypothetical protein
MATIWDVADQLPHGFHDSYLERLSIDFERRVAVFDLELWVGDETSKDEDVREAMRAGQLLLEGLRFCVLDPPHPDGPYAEPGAAWLVDICEADLELPPARQLPAGAFAARFFVHQWNAFIHVAATHAELRWV